MTFPKLLQLEESVPACSTKKSPAGLQRFRLDESGREGNAAMAGSGRVTQLWLIKAAWDEQSVRRAYEDGRCGPGLEDVNCLLAIFWGGQKHHDGDYLSFPQHARPA